MAAPPNLTSPYVSVPGPSRHLVRRSDMSGFGVKAEVAGARSKRRF